MKRSTIIATCLRNMDLGPSIEECERVVQSEFAKHFPDDVFSDWNREVDSRVANQIISNVGRASRIHVDRFINDLRKIR